MSDARIEVIAYSGYRGEETPRAFTLHDKSIEVTEIEERWIEEGIEDKTTRRCFKVKGDDRLVHTLCYNEKAMEWYYRFED